MSFGNFQAVGSGFCLAERELRILSLVNAMYIFKDVDHIATLASMFQAWELQYFEALRIRLLFQR